MHNSVYIAIADDGHISLFWGDGTEDFRERLLRGPRPRDNRELVAIIEDMKIWAEDHGYTVVVPACDLAFTDIELELTEDDQHRLRPDDIDDLLNDLFLAEDNDT